MKIIRPFIHSFLDYPSPDYSCISLYVLGCEHNCKDCSSPQLQDFNYNADNVIHKISIETIASQIYHEIEYLPYKQVCLIGGDWLHPLNIEDTKILLNIISTVRVCIYTGYSVDYCKKNNVTGFTFLKCGCYDSLLKVQSEKTDDYIQFASTNQKLYDKDYNLISKNGRYYFV